MPDATCFAVVASAFSFVRHFLFCARLAMWRRSTPVVHQHFNMRHPHQHPNMMPMIPDVGTHQTSPPLPLSFLHLLYPNTQNNASTHPPKPASCRSTGQNRERTAHICETESTNNIDCLWPRLNCFANTSTTLGKAPRCTVVRLIGPTGPKRSAGACSPPTPNHTPIPNHIEVCRRVSFRGQR